VFFKENYADFQQKCKFWWGRSNFQPGYIFQQNFTGNFRLGLISTGQLSTTKVIPTYISDYGKGELRHGHYLVKVLHLPVKD
jgi:hypothetical protein